MEAILQSPFFSLRKPPTVGGLPVNMDFGPRDTVEESRPQPGFLKQGLTWLRSVALGYDPSSLASALKAYKDPEARAAHDFKAYMKAFPSQKFAAREVIEWTPQSVAVELEGNRILRLMPNPLAADHGHREFDCPAFEKGQAEVTYRPGLFRARRTVTVHYAVQPRTVPGTADDKALLAQEARAAGYQFQDGSVGRYFGRVVLHDYHSATP